MPSLDALEAFYQGKQGNQVHYLSNVFCGYSLGETECMTCPAGARCPNKGGRA